MLHIIGPDDDMPQWNTEIPLRNDLMLLDKVVKGDIVHVMVIIFPPGDHFGKEMVDIDSGDLNLFADLNLTVIIYLLLLLVFFLKIVNTDKIVIGGVAVYG